MRKRMPQAFWLHEIMDIGVVTSRLLTFPPIAVLTNITARAFFADGTEQADCSNREPKNVRCKAAPRTYLNFVTHSPSPCETVAKNCQRFSPTPVVRIRLVEDSNALQKLETAQFEYLV